MASTPRLIVINGPIASGKTSVARALASWVRGRGKSAAAIDMDDLVEIVMGSEWGGSTPAHWRMARTLATALIERLAELDVEVVVLSGPFFTEESRAELREGLKLPAITFVTLEVSLEESIRRCLADDARVITKDPQFVSRIYNGIEWRLLPADDVFLSTEATSLDDAVHTVARRLGLS